MSKKEMISLRISSQQKETCKKLNLTYSQVWEAGFQNLVPKKKEELKILAQKHKDLYIQYEQMYIQFENENIENLTKLDEKCKIYMKKGEVTRSIENPTNLDLSWIKANIEKNNLNVTIDEFLKRCKLLKKEEGAN